MLKLIGIGLPGLFGLVALSALTSGSAAVAGTDPGSLAYGPTQCKSGYVWREAFNGDFVCVTPQRRTETRDNNAQAATRREPGGGAYGFDTCRQGFVWREARPSDRVCVVPYERTQVATENRTAIGRFALFD